VIDADAHSDVALFADFDNGEQTLFNGVEFLLDLGRRILFCPLARLAVDEEPRVQPDFVDIPGHFDSDIRALVVDVGDQRNLVTAPVEVGADLAQVSGVGYRRSRDPDKLTARPIKPDYRLHTGGDIACLFGDHRLNEDRCVAADDRRAGVYLAGGSSLTYNVHVHCLSRFRPAE